jgi:short-subunit dehydrogenase
LQTNNYVLIRKKLQGGFMFKDNVSVITGASAGIGKELALQLAKQGALLSLAARDVKKLETIAEECRRLGGKVIVTQTDVACKEQCKNLIDRTVTEYGCIDSLYNNAGISMSARFDEIKDVDLFETIMKVNYLGSVYCTYYALPHLKKTKGRIIGISSLTGKVGVPTRTGYAASKHAVAGFFDSLRIELINTGVTVTVIYPGFVTTEIRERALGIDGKPLGKSHLDESKVMSVEECVKQILSASLKRKREVVMTAKAKLGLWMKLIAPELIDKTSSKSIEKGH